MDDYDAFVALYVMYVSYLIYDSISDDETQSETERETQISKPSPAPTPKKRKRTRKAIKKDDSSKKQKRSIWVKEINLDRNVSGYFARTFEAIKDNNPGEFFKHTRMSRHQYDKLLDMVKHDLTKKSMRPSISFECRLAITLSYLSQGLTQQHLAETFKAGRSSIRQIILETCTVIWNTLSPIYVGKLSCEDYEEISKGFFDKLNMPNCVGAVDEKYFNISCPPRKGVHKNLRMTFLATCDSNYCFTSVGIDLYSKDNEAGSNFATKFLNNETILPIETNLPNSEIIFPYYFVGNSNFPLKKHILRPYPGKFLEDKQMLFNRKLLKVHRLLENTIGILAARWKVLQTVFTFLPENVKTIFLATIALHNYIQQTSLPYNEYCPEFFTDWEDDDRNLRLGDWRNEVHNYFKSGKLGSNNASKTSINLRDELCEYFFNTEKHKFPNVEEETGDEIFSEF